VHAVTQCKHSEPRLCPPPDKRLELALPSQRMLGTSVLLHRWLLAWPLGASHFRPSTPSDLRRAADTAQAIADSCGVAEVGSAKLCHGPCDVALHWPTRNVAFLPPRKARVFVSNSGSPLIAVGALCMFCRCAHWFQVVKLPGLRERHAGDVQGLTPQEASEKQPAAYRCFLSRDPLFLFPVCTPRATPCTELSCTPG